MTAETFDLIFAPIRKKWEYHFTADACLVIYNIVINAPEDSFRTLCKNLLFKKPFEPPEVEDFQNFSRKFSRKHDINIKFCEFCGYQGVVACLDGVGDSWVYRCSCEHAKDVPTRIKISDDYSRPFKQWDDVKHLYKIIPPIDKSLEVFTDEERKDLFKFLQDVIAQRIPKNEIKERLEYIESAVRIAAENKRRA